VLSSPYVRCVQTVQPLAEAVGLDVEQTPALAEGNAPQAVKLIHELAGTNAALCTHGDVIPTVLQSLEAEGVQIVSPLEWRKGSTWVLHTDDGSPTRATYVPRPL
jgi:8-oxo-dGTP diphosphatase